jgi:hypothetical protein
MTKFHSSKCAAVVFVAGDGRELFKSRVRPPAMGELVATCERVFEVIGGSGKTIKVRPWQG